MNPHTDPFAGRVVVGGSATATLAYLDKPLSFWGGYDAEQGRIVEPSHPQVGQSLAGRILVMEKAKGSSSSSSVLAEAIRHGTGPVGIIMKESDLIVALGCIVADELYGTPVPLAVVDDTTWAQLLQLPRDATVHLDCSASDRAVLRMQ